MSVAIDVLHAFVMIVWVISLPFVFFHRWPTLSLAAACYSIGFVIVNRFSHLILGECILTRLARDFGSDRVADDEKWFTVRFSRMIFGFIPSNKQVVYVEQALIIGASLGSIFVLLRRLMMKKHR